MDIRVFCLGAYILLMHFGTDTKNKRNLVAWKQNMNLMACNFEFELPFQVCYLQEISSSDFVHLLFNIILQEAKSFLACMKIKQLPIAGRECGIPILFVKNFEIATEAS